MCEVELPTLFPPTAQPARSQLDRCNPRVLDGTDLRPAIYEGRPVTASSAVDALLRPHVERATARADTPLGVTVAGVQRSVREESALAQLMADLIRSGASRVQGQPVDLAVQNGGGMRNDLPAGPLTYGHVFEVQPFDSRLAIRRLSGAQLAEVFRRNLGSVHGVLVPSGIRVEVQCEGGEPRVTLRRESGEPLDLARVYSVAMSDFLASGGDDFASLAPEQATPGASVTPVTYYDDMLLRDLIVEELSRYHGPLLSGQMQPSRIVLPSPRPLRCASQ